MSKLDDIFSKFSREVDAVTVVWTDASLVADVKQDVKRLMLELVGETKFKKGARQDRYLDEEVPRYQARSEIRSELRRKVEAL